MMRAPRSHALVFAVLFAAVVALPAAGGRPADAGAGARGAQKSARIKVTIDIKPGDEPTTMDPKSRGMVPVALLSTREFDARTIDPQSVRFGASGTEAAPFRSMREDVDHDGDMDVLFLFRMTETGIGCEQKSASLTGTTAKGQAVEGSESFTTSGCEHAEQ